MTSASSSAGTGYWLHQLQGVGEIGAFLSGAGLRLFGPPDLQEGDVVFLWIGGGEPGLKGWGIARVHPNASQSADGTDRAPQGPATVYSLDMRLSLSSPIPRTEFASLPGLSDAPLIRQNQRGEYFRLSAEQALGLADFLRGRDLQAPDIAPEAILDPIAKRLERELNSLSSMLPDIVGPAISQVTLAHIRGGQEELQRAGPVAAHGRLKLVTDALASLVPALDSKGALAPMAAALARLTNDLAQVERFADSGTPPAAEAKASPRGPLAFVQAPAPVPSLAPSPLAGAAPSAGTAPSAAGPASATTTPTPAPVSPAPKPPAPPKDPLFTHWEQSDLIGISAAVNNLARYISHENLVPPIAIGVFGDWGSGKTFFIRALQSQIALFSSQSRDALADNPPRTTVFCSHIVQVEFNAWHFVESNLWASLAAHIFERLYEELDRRGEKEGGNRNIDGLYQQFSAYKQAVDEQKRLTELVGTLAAKRNDAAERKRKAGQTFKARIAAFIEALKGQVGKLSGEQLSKQDRSRLDDLLHASSVEELEAAATKAAAIVKEGQTFLGRVRVQFSWWGGWQLAIFIVAIAAAAFGLPALVHRLLDAQADNLQRISTLVGGYAAVAISALGWLSRAGRKLLDSAQKVERVLVDVRKQVESQPSPELDSAKRELAAAEAELEVVDKQIVQQRDRLAELADELDPNQLGTRLRNFLEQHAKNSAYQKHLGLVSTVRKDFSSLYDLMQKYWQNRKKPVPEVLADVRDALGKATQAQVPFIERIVLYIDDLDRCPEDKVVEVLQAVHLMLGLPLFVVVVAVDERWMGQSIRKHYGKLVGWDDQNGVLSNGLASASADDYLEKIFQIPYRIHPMERDVRKTFLGGILRQPYLSAAAATQTPTIALQELVPKELSLYPEEEKAIEALHPSVGSSPRRVRRFLDAYRLMRAGMEEGDVQSLIAARHYGVVLALFAILSGAPVTAPRVIEELRRETQRPSGEPGSLALTLQPLASWYSALSQIEGTADEIEVIKSAMSYIDGLNLDRASLIAMLQRWIPEIARYSFRAVRMQRFWHDAPVPTSQTAPGTVLNQRAA